jgi:hypothetical protein
MEALCYIMVTTIHGPRAIISTGRMSFFDSVQRHERHFEGTVNKLQASLKEWYLSTFV